METTIEKVYFTIDEVAKMLEVNHSTLRFWEDNFEWICPRRNYRNKRKYKKLDIELLTDIKTLLYLGGMTLEGVRTAHNLNYLEELRDFYLSKIQ